MESSKDDFLSLRQINEGLEHKVDKLNDKINSLQIYNCDLEVNAIIHLC